MTGTVRHSHSSVCRGRGHCQGSQHGFVMPYVLIALSVVGVLAFTLATTALRDGKAVSRAANAQRISMMGDEALAVAAQNWRRDSLWSHDPDTSITEHAQLSSLESQTVTIRRSHPLVAWISAVMTHEDPSSAQSVRRELTRAVWLEPPPVAIAAALTVSGDVSASDPTLISGNDVYDSGSPCGSLSDTVSVAAMSADAVRSDSGSAWTLRPPDHGRDNLDSIPGVRQLLDAAAAMGSTELRSAVPAPVVDGVESLRWQILSLRGGLVHLSGASRYRGLLVVDGSLIVTGSLRLDGILLVTGTLDASQGQLAVVGAVIVLGAGEVASVASAQLGSATTIRFDRCMVEMALATVATPGSVPFRLWDVGAP